MTELEATRQRIYAAAKSANFSDAARTRALHLATSTPNPQAWQEFLGRALALLGAGLVLAGVVCFVAFNWDEIGRFGKFALIQLAIAGATLVAWRTLPKVSGQVALLASAVLVGPLLALYGQTYQTGADPYGLFLTWFALIIPWVIAARFGALWILALVLLDVALVLYWFQVLGIDGAEDQFFLPLALAALHGAAVVAWEWQLRRAHPWIDERWGVRVIAVLGYVPLFIIAAAFLVLDAKAGAAGPLGVAGLAAAVAGSFLYYGRKRADRFMVTLAIIAALGWVNVGIGRVLFDLLHLEISAFFLMSALTIWEITQGLKWYRRSRRSPLEAEE